MNANFQYTVLPSASQIGELPSYLAFKALTSDNAGLAVAGYVFGFVAIPISIAFTPIAIIADIVVGIAEAIFIAYKEAGQKEVQELLFKKIITCPVQQTLSAITKTVIFLICPLFWTLAYSCSQGIIKILPDYLNHKRMNIFINGGITDKNSTKTCFDEEIQLTSYQFKNDNNGSKAKGSSSKNTHSQTLLKARIAEAIVSVSRINNAHTPQKYLQFKQKILNQASAQNIFGFSNNQFTQSDLLKKYKQLTLIVHPDKNIDCQREAHLLFHCLQAAYFELKQLAL
ncbi:MAG: J domain-containing protein [Candidatus Rhabdochlamydia sp.]